MNWYVDRSGLTRLPEIATSAGVVIGVSTTGVVLYYAYPTVMVAAGTPEGQYYLQGFVDAISPMMPTNPIGSGARIIQELYPNLQENYYFLP